MEKEKLYAVVNTETEARVTHMYSRKGDAKRRKTSSFNGDKYKVATYELVLKEVE